MDTKTRNEKAWGAACRAWSRDAGSNVMETIRLGETMMYAATDRICELETVHEAAQRLAEAFATVRGMGEPLPAELDQAEDALLLALGAMQEPAQ